MNATEEHNMRLRERRLARINRAVAVEIPAWVPSAYRVEYRRIAGRRCEEEAAAFVRAARAAKADPAPTQRSDGRAEGSALKGPTGSLREDSHDTGSTDDRNERVEGSVTPQIEAGQERKPAPSISQGREATRTEDLGRVVAEPVVEPGPSETEVEIGPRAPIVGSPPRAPYGDLTRAPEPPAPVTVSTSDFPAPAPLKPSAAAGALAGAARQMRTARAAPVRRDASVGVITGAVEISYRPDRPACERGAVVIPVPGEPPPGRRELLERQRQTETRGRDRNDNIVDWP